MSTSFTLPPSIRRFGRCGEEDQPDVVESPRQSAGEVRRNEYRHPPLYGAPGAGADRVKTFVNGIVSPFTACWQPSVGSCVSDCAPDQVFQKQPAVVSPLTERAVPYRERKFEREQDVHPRHYRPYPSPHGPASYYPPVYSPKSTSPSRTSAASPQRTEEHDSVIAAPTSPDEKSKRKTDIAKPQASDILCGRGGSSNRHQGNIHFRELVAANKHIYVGLTKKQKMMVARKVVDAVHSTGGRFLAKDLDTGLFYDIGLPRSLEKTSQALREKHSNELPGQAEESEEIETSVESHNRVVNDDVKNEESKQPAGESPAGGTSSLSKITPKNPKNVQAPSLIIPPHLVKIFDPKGSKSSGEDWKSHHEHARSPIRNPSSEQVAYESYHSPYPPSPYRMPPGSSPSHHHRVGYPPGPGYPSPQPSHHRHPHYHTSPVPSNTHYRSHPYYYHHRGPSRTPPHGRSGHGPEEGYGYPAYGDREAYNNDYYARSLDHEQPGGRPSSHDKHPPPYPARYNPYPGHHYPPQHHGRPVSHGGPPPSPRSGPEASQSLPPYRPSNYSPHYYSSRSSPPSMPHDTSPTRSIRHRKSSNGCVRGNSEVSPARQRELKRPRNDDGQTTTVADASLSSAVKKSLSLDERVVGRERERRLETINGTDDENSSSRHVELISPSTMLQSSAHSRQWAMDVTDKCSPSEKKEDYSALSGLAALSTAAFLQLDDDEDKK